MVSEVFDVLFNSVSEEVRSDVSGRWAALLLTVPAEAVELAAAIPAAIPAAAPPTEPTAIATFEELDSGEVFFIILCFLFVFVVWVILKIKTAVGGNPISRVVIFS